MRPPCQLPRRTSFAAVLVLVLFSSAAPEPAIADDDSAPSLWDSVLEKLDVKAKPAAPAPDFVERTRPDPAGLGYIQPSVPHKVSPLAVKTPAQIQAAKDALDAAKAQQLNPVQKPPVQLPTSKKAKTQPATAVN